MMRTLSAFCVALFCLPVSTTAQTYLNAVGNPPSSVNIPIENGYINITNGNLHMEFHLATMKQRGALKLDEKLVYDSRIWTVGCYSNCYWWPTNIPNTPYAQAGWRFVTGAETGSVSYLYGNSTVVSTGCPAPPYDGSDTVTTSTPAWTDPSGTVHVFDATLTAEQNDCTGAYTQTINGGPANDASGYSVQDDGTGNAVVFDNNGTQVYPQVIDRYGNYWSFDANGNLIDDLGHTPVIVTTNGNVTYYDVLSPNGPINNQGTRVRYTVTTSSILVSTQFQNGAGEWQGTLNPVQSIQLPDGSSYTFTYEHVYGNVVHGYGEPTSVTLPTGGVIYYGWNNYFDSYQNANRWLASRTVGSNPPMTFTPQVINYCSPKGTGCQEQVNVHKPSGDETVYQLTLNNGAWDTNVTAYSGSAASGTALTMVANTFDFSHPCQTPGCSGAEAITGSSEVTTLLDTTASISTQTQYAYTNPWFGKLSSLKQWDYYIGSGSTSSTPTRETDYVYSGYDLTQETLLAPNPNQAQGQPAQIQVAQTQYGYTTSAAAITGAPQHGTTNDVGPYLHTISQLLQTNNSLLTTTYVMDNTGMVTNVTDPNSNPPTATTYQCSNTLPYQVTNALGQTTTYSYDCNSGALVSMKDPNDSAAGRAGRVYQYEATAGRLQSISYPDGGQTSYSYPSFTEVDASILATPDPAITSQSILDSFGRPYQTVQNGISTETTYDANGRVNCITNPHLSTSSSTDGTACITTYDGLDRPTLETEQDNTQLKWKYQGNTVTSTDEAGKSWQRSNDAFGELTSVIEPGNLQSSYVYDALGDLTSMTQQGASGETPRVRTFTYDSLGRMVLSATPEQGTITYGYDSNSNQNSITSPAPNSSPGSAQTVTATYKYDPLNRLTDKLYSDGLTPNQHFQYDLTSSWMGTQYNTIGRLARAYTDQDLRYYGTGNRPACNPQSSATANYNSAYGNPTYCTWTDELFTYDAMGRQTRIGVAPPSEAGWAAHEIDMTYDLAGKMTSLTYPDGRVVTQAWDTSSRLQNVAFGKWNGQQQNYTYASGFTYLPPGEQAEVNYGNGVYIHTPYNNREQMCQVWSSGPQTVRNPVLMDTHIYYGSEIFCGNTPGNNGNISEIKDWRNSNRTRQFGYDGLNRINLFNNGNNSMQQSFTYDSFGNLSQSGTQSFIPVYKSNNQISSYGYDAAGNMLQFDYGFGTLGYSYDAESKMFKTSSGGYYTYDAADERMRKDFNGDYIEYQYLDGQVIAEKHSNGIWTDYIYANGQKIARIDGVDNRVHTHGVFTAGGNELRWNLPIPSNPDGSTYTIQTGDQLCVRQYNNNAVGGPGVGYSDGTYSAWDGRWTDANGVEMNQMSSPQNKWIYRCADLSLGGAKTGQTLAWLGILTDVNTQAGTWDIYYADMAIISTDDTVRPVIGPNPPTPQCCAFQGTGWTQTPTATVEAPADYPPDNVTVHYFAGDQIGSSWMETSNGGWPMWRGEYYPFGTEQYVLPTANNYKFATLERDSETNLDHSQFRQYSFAAGRWMTPDPYNGSYDLANPQSFNRYAYTLNNPLSLIDPSGLDGDNPNSGYGLDPIYDLLLFLSNLFGGSSFHGSLTPRPNNHIWDEHGGFHPSPYSSIASMIGDVDGWYPSGCEFGVCGDSFGSGSDSRSSSSIDWAYWRAIASGIFSADTWIQGTKEGWNKGYYKCLGKHAAGGVAAPVVTHLGGMAATKAAEENASMIAGAYYHFTDGRFTAWGRSSKVLVPKLAPRIAVAAKAADAAGWLYFDYEMIKGARACYSEAY